MSAAYRAAYAGSDGVVHPATITDNRPQGGSLFIEYFEGGRQRIAYLDALPPQLDSTPGLHSPSAGLT